MLEPIVFQHDQFRGTVSKEIFDKIDLLTRVVYKNKDVLDGMPTTFVHNREFGDMVDAMHGKIYDNTVDLRDEIKSLSREVGDGKQLAVELRQMVGEQESSIEIYK